MQVRAGFPALRWISIWSLFGLGPFAGR